MPAEAIMSVAGIISSLIVVFGAVYALYKLAKRIDAAIGTDDQGRSISERLDRVEHQLWENGGSSLADRVNNIEKHVIKSSTELEFIKNLTLGISNSTIPNSIPQGLLSPTEEPLVRRRVSKSKKVS
jgi:hypothetical protein